MVETTTEELLCELQWVQWPTVQPSDDRWFIYLFYYVKIYPKKVRKLMDT